MSDRLLEAAAEGDTATVVRLLSEGVATQADKDGWTPLHHAASGGYGDTVAALLLANCDVQAVDSFGFNALQRAAAEGHEEVVKLLIKHNVNLDHQDDLHGNTALHEACWKGYSQTVQLLCRAGANLYIKNRGGFIPLHLCCQNGHNQSCRELLLAGCDPDLQNNYGDTPLHTSARYGHAGVTRILISALCAVSEQNKNGDTSLHISAAMGRRKLTRILLEAGCDQTLKNKQNESAMDIADRKDFEEIVSILKNPPPVVKPCVPEDDKGKTEKRKEDKNKSNEKKRGKPGSGTSSKESSTRAKEKKHKGGAPRVHFEQPSKGLQQKWSPYGCHYFPDLREFPAPNLDSLPKEPLQKGEQYYLDLAGNIRKGPIGVGTTCYCGPLLCHVTRQMHRDKKELLGHIDGAREWLDRRLTVVEQRTRTQIEALDHSVKERLGEERERCEKKREENAEKHREMVKQHTHRIRRWLRVQGQAQEGGEELGIQDKPSSAGSAPVDVHHTQSESEQESDTAHPRQMSEPEEQQWTEYSIQAAEQWQSSTRDNKSDAATANESLEQESNDDEEEQSPHELGPDEQQTYFNEWVASTDIRRRNLYLPSGNEEEHWLQDMYKCADSGQRGEVSGEKDSYGGARPKQKVFAPHPEYENIRFTSKTHRSQCEDVT